MNSPVRFSSFKSVPAIFTLLVVILFTQSILAVPPHPSIRPETASSAQSSLVPHSHNKPDGLCEPDDFFSKFLEKRRTQIESGASLAPAASQFKILALLVDFSDHTSGVSSTFFDSLVFDSAGNTIRDYFSEVSYAQLDLVTVNLPSSVGWSRAPQTYAYYVDGQRGIYGTYPNNSQGLVSDLVNLVDPSVDFSQYDNDADGFVDILLVIHSGTGAELSNNDNDIHSHKWSLPSPMSKDGVSIWSYTVQPEFWYTAGDMTIGVYAHELCHGFGLPDLYDTDYSSNGVGDWDIMAFGSWNGPGNLGGSPSHPSAWSRIEMGFATAVEVTANIVGQIISPVETGGSIFRLPSVSGVSNEYFLVENRKLTGYDSFIPAEGLLIWHIDSNKAGNTQEWYPAQNPANHYKVALEQADGLWDLEKSALGGNSGDVSDPFPGWTGNTSFSVSSIPASDSYTSGSTITSVNNIANAGNDIIADFIVSALAGIDDNNDFPLPSSVDLSQNYPNPFNPSTTILFNLQQSAEIDISVYNILGEKIRTVFSGRAGAGVTSVEWDATDYNDNPVASGVYFYTLATDNDEEVTKKMVLVR